MRLASDRAISDPALCSFATSPDEATSGSGGSHVATACARSSGRSRRGCGIECTGQFLKPGMARANRRRIFRLPRRADQQPGAERVSIPRPRSLASAVMSAQPKSKSAMDANNETGRRVPSPAASPPSLAKCALRRQTPEVEAECPNWARSELSGGRSEAGIPTGNR
jgi:hypothetical protein